MYQLVADADRVASSRSARCSAGLGAKPRRQSIVGVRRHPASRRGRPRGSRAPCARAVKRSSKTSRHAAAVERRSPGGRDRLVAGRSTMKPVTPSLDHLAAPSRGGRRSPACRRPSPRSSPGRTARASRSGTAAPRASPRKLRPSAARRSRRRTRPAGGRAAARSPARSSRGRPGRPWRRCCSGMPAPCAISMARSTRFSGEMRPRNAR